MQLTIIIDDARVAGGLHRANERVTARVEEALWRGAQEMGRLARRLAPKAFSTLINSIIATRIGDLHYRIAPGVDYAQPVEQGRAPGRQPGTAKGLMEWVKQKTGLTGTDLDRRTFLVARAIGQRGIKPQPYMRPALEEESSRLRSLVENAVTRGLAESMA